MRDAAVSFLLFGASFGLGMGLNRLLVHPLPLVYAPKTIRMQEAVQRIASGAPLPETPEPSPVSSSSAAAPSMQLIMLDEFRQHAEQRDGLVLDARPEVFYQLGHVPGALSLARKDFEAAYAKLRSRLESNKSQLLLVYCAGNDCEDSQMVADALVRLGYSNVRVFKGGWEEWTGAQLPEEKSP